MIVETQFILISQQNLEKNAFLLVIIVSIIVSSPARSGLALR